MNAPSGEEEIARGTGDARPFHEVARKGQNAMPSVEEVLKAVTAAKAHA